MRVLLVNGSPRKNGCTFTALCEVARELEAQGIETEMFQLGTKPVRGCIACGRCKDGKCIFDDDIANALAERLQQADGVVVGSPVYYAAANGALCAVLSRVFYAGGRRYAYKPAAAIVSCRRSGGSAAFDQLNKYFTISQMPIVSSEYWNIVHGASAEEVLQDKEGMHVVRTIGRNMAWMLQSLQRGEVEKPTPGCRPYTNFIR